MNFIIYAPPYKADSGGITVLYNLKDDLNKLGHTCSIIHFGNKTTYDPNSIVIYPEIISNNPLNAKYVIRYFLHMDGYISGTPVNIGSRDFIITWSKCYYPNAHAVLYNYPITKHFHDKNTEPPLNRNIDCTWIHKGANHTKATVIPNSIHIAANGPLSNKGLADLLRQTRILYSYDILTRVVYEAIFCGAYVVPLLWQPFTAQDIVNSELEFPWISVKDNNLIIPLDYTQQRDRFIQKVQKVNGQYINTLETVINQISNHFGIK